MLHLDNRSPYGAGLFPGWSQTRRFQETLVVKAGFRFDAGGQLAPLNPPPAIETADEHYGPPLKTSLAAVAEVMPFKMGGELYVYGTAQPPPHARVMEVELGLEGNGRALWKNTLRITGKRTWRRKMFGLEPTDPEVLTPVPLRYELAYGGCNEHAGHETDWRNPVGTGYTKAQRAQGMALPQIEGEGRFLSRPGDAVRPAGWGPLASFWSPRRELHAKPHVAAARTPECPYGQHVPPDFFNVAPAALRFARAFQAGDRLSLRGLVRDVAYAGRVALELPDLRLSAVLTEGRAERAVPLSCDTLIVDCDQQTLCLVLRGAIDARPLDPVNRYVRVEGQSLFLAVNEGVAAAELAT